MNLSSLYHSLENFPSRTTRDETANPASAVSGGPSYRKSLS